MQKKRAWTRNTYGTTIKSIPTLEDLTPEQQLIRARKQAARAKGGLFKPLNQINDAHGHPLTGLPMMQELA